MNLGSSGTFGFFVTCICAILCVFAVGCAPWKKDPTTKSKLPEIRTAPDNVPIEILVLEVDKTDENLLQQMWDEIDPTRIELSIRQKQDENGIRSGIIDSKTSASLSHLIEIDRNRRVNEQVAAESLAAEQTVQKAMRVQAGRPFQVVVSKTYPSLNWIMNDSGYLFGKESPLAQCGVSYVARLSQDGSIRLEATPEIQYGTPKQRIDVGNNSLVYKTSRDKHSFETLRIASELTPGETLVISTNQDPSGLGVDFFKEADANSNFTKVVLVRFAEMKIDNLFIPEQNNTTIVTPTD